MKKVQFILISTILSLGLIVSSALISNAVIRSSNSLNKITVKGVSERKIKADRAMVTVEFWRKSQKLEQGEEMMEEISNRIYGIIPDLELSRGDFKMEPTNVATKFVGSTNTPSAYELSRKFTVSTKNVDEIQNIYEKLKLLELDFNNLKVSKPVYSISNIEKYKNEMLVEATKNAERKAFDILKVSEDSVGELKQLSQNNFEILKNDNEIEKDKFQRLRVVVTATYGINKIK